MKRGFFFAVIVFVLCVSVNVSATGANNPARLFLVASYDCDNVCGAPQETGALNELRDSGWIEGENLILGRFYMQTKSRYTSPDEIHQRGLAALEKIRQFNPDIVLTFDDNAFREVGLALAGGPVPVVFSGLNGQPEDYNRMRRFMTSRQHPEGNITGVYEKLYLKHSLEVLAAAFPGLRGGKVVGITDDSPTGKALSKQFRIELGQARQIAGLQWEERQVKTFGEYQNLIRQLNENPEVVAIYPVAVRLPTADGTTRTARQIFPWTIAHSTKPEMALNYYFSKLGLFGGAAVDFRKMGAVAGRQVGWILEGRRAGDLAIVDAPDYAIVFNLTRAKELGLQIPMPLLTAADHIYR
ncbi:hypothetical protein C2E25_07740 [Geothermobacter hydrogeniphilus]|uniref:ABC transporter substrate-binding protein n=1 Tax=Geothermobacter hydrogeniphilus TaxID=1969733 RepID=A0A2K2HAG5_9BACT|nr:ABC transporter substrate binding protein [Geothermobacter hydrogeniphilus]PNU20308.1 hypothetical protein C2E25_07740 [Geothermobacter hydrogeniphilus]